jgi:peptide/nickel transport system permease protein
MLNYFFRRLGYMVITLAIVTVLGYIIIELPPGSYVETEIQRLQRQGGTMSMSQVDALYRRYGLDQPAYVRFWKWVSGFARGDFGEAFMYNMPVSKLIGARLGFTVMISLLTLVFSWVVAIIIGVYSATHRYSAPDYIITVLQFIGLAVPNFMLALILMMFAQQVLHLEVGGLFSRQYENAPFSFAKFVDLLKHLWIPIIVIGASGTAWLSRVMRANLLDVLNMQYVQTARAKGLHENAVIWKHAVRNAIHPLIMVLGGSLPAIISGETIVAIVLNLPTTGPLYFNALLSQDMYLAGTFLMFLAIMLLIGNLAADMLLAWVDPRIRYE